MKKKKKIKKKNFLKIFSIVKEIHVKENILFLCVFKKNLFKKYKKKGWLFLGVVRLKGAPQKKEKFKKRFFQELFTLVKETQSSIGVMEGPEEFYGKQGRPLPGGKREIMVEDPMGEYGGITGFEGIEDKFPSGFMSDLGTWVSESPRVADEFAMSGEAGAIYPLKLKMKNPKEYDTYEELEHDFRTFDGDNTEFVEALKKEGHDGIMIRESDTGYSRNQGRLRCL